MGQTPSSPSVPRGKIKPSSRRTQRNNDVVCSNKGGALQVRVILPRWPGSAAALNMQKISTSDRPYGPTTTCTFQDVGPARRRYLLESAATTPAIESRSSAPH